MTSPTSRHHTEWLSLLEISGPFLSLPVLLNIFPQGLDDYPPEEAHSLRADYEFWQEDPDNPAVFTAWVRLVLESGLGYTGSVLLTGQAIPAGWKAEFPEYGETLRPDWMLVEPGAHTPRLLIQVFPPGQDLGKAVSGSRWQASAATRMMELLHAAEVRLGLATNGKQWMLVDAPRGETTGFITWTAGLWFEEPLTLRAFRSLLGVKRFFGVAANQTLESMLAESANDQQEVTDQLGLQVRHAVEILIQMIDRADQDSGGKLLGALPQEALRQVPRAFSGILSLSKDVDGVSPDLLYEAALTVMMRLVFMLSAEERKLLPLDDSLYADHYAVSTLRAQLRELADQHGEEVLERRFDAWSRLLAAFRAVHGGIYHERLALPAYGGSLFDPDKYPFLEGRSWLPLSPRASGEGQGGRGDRGEIPLPINNRTVLHLLDALQMLQVGGEARRLSFRALDVEQIGHVYEGLLDHHAVRAGEVIVGLRGAKRQEPEVALSALEQEIQKTEAAFLEWLKDLTGRSPAALKNALQGSFLQKSADFEARLRSAAGNDEALLQRLAPFAGLLRLDDFGFPVIILPGSVYVTQGATRRATGTHYTPRSLTEPVVQHTLEPLVYEGPAEGWPRERWRLRSSAELLDLKVCDMAMGSGGFLVQADRYLAERLVEAWEMADRRRQLAEGRRQMEEGGKQTAEGSWQTEEGGFPSADGDFPSAVYSLSSADDRLIFARRLAAERCLYGVDKNPLAVEIAKLSLWLATMAKDLPFTFLDHALKCGDSLVGAGEADFKGWAHGWQAPEATLFDEQLERQIETARQKRRDLETFVVRDVQDARRKAGLLQEAEAAMANIKLGCDLLTGTRLLGLKSKEVEDLQINLLIPYMAGKFTPGEALRQVPRASGILSLSKDDSGGEEALRQAQRASGILSLSKDDPQPVEGYAGGWIDPVQYPDAARALAAARKERAFHWEFEFPEVFGKGGFNAIVGNPPFMGGKKISTNLGDMYLNYIATFIANGTKGSADLCAFFYLKTLTIMKLGGMFGLLATNTIAQGGTKEVGLDKLAREKFKIIRGISSFKWPGVANLEVAIVWAWHGDWLGSFVLDNKIVDSISTSLSISSSMEANPKKLSSNKALAFVGSFPMGDGFVISRFEADNLINHNADNRDVIFPFLNGSDINSNPDSSPSRYVINFRDWPIEKVNDYQECLNILIERVKPYRDKIIRRGKQIHEHDFWKFWDKRLDAYKAISHLSKVLVIALTSRTGAFVFNLNPTGVVFSHAVGIFAFDDYSHFSILQSTLHIQWAWTHGSSLKGDLRYAPSDIFETFPFPKKIVGLGQIGETYHETRRQIMLNRQEGLTATYNRFHNPQESASDIARLRDLHVEMDNAVAAAYGWQDLPLGHGFHETAQGVRYTIHESARREVLSRLLKLNHERYEEEVQAGLHEAKGKGKGEGGKEKKKGRAVKEAQGQYGLF